MKNFLNKYTNAIMLFNILMCALLLLINISRNDIATSVFTTALLVWGISQYNYQKRVDELFNLLDQGHELIVMLNVANKENVDEIIRLKEELERYENKEGAL